MKAMAGETNHPNAEVLALFSRGDLPWMERWKTRRHVTQCSLCEQEVARFRFATEQLQHEAAAQTLTGFEAIADWTRLEREMLGNIAVGVAAARCIDNVGRKRPGLRKLAVACGLIVLFVAGWFTHIPSAENSHLLTALRQAVGANSSAVRSGQVLETSADGISVQSQGATLTILHPRSAVVSMAGASSVRARYVDEDSGEVTITSVYGQ